MFRPNIEVVQPNASFSFRSPKKQISTYWKIENEEPKNENFSRKITPLMQF